MKRKGRVKIICYTSFYGQVPCDSSYSSVSLKLLLNLVGSIFIFVLLFSTMPNT